MFKGLTAIASLAVLLTLASPVLAQSPTSWVKVGGLNCTMSPTIGLLVVEEQAVNADLRQTGTIHQSITSARSERWELPSASSAEACWRGPYTCLPRGRHKVRSPALTAELAAILM